MTPEAADGRSSLIVAMPSRDECQQTRFESETGAILYPARSFAFSEPSCTPEIRELWLWYPTPLPESGDLDTHTPRGTYV